MYVGNDVAKAPTTIHAHPTQFGIQMNDLTLPPNTVSIEDYNKVAESAHGWKNAYYNLNNQTGSGINTEEAVEVIKKWKEAYQNLYVQKNAALQQLFNQTREMEIYPLLWIKI